MALKIRLQRGGKKNSPIYAIVVAESSAPRDGKFVEKLGTYNPSPGGNDFQIMADLERYEYWLSKGAKPTNTVRSLVRSIKRKFPEAKGKAELRPSDVAVAA